MAETGAAVDGDPRRGDEVPHVRQPRHVDGPRPSQRVPEYGHRSTHVQETSQNRRNCQVNLYKLNFCFVKFLRLKRVQNTFVFVKIY